MASISDLEMLFTESELKRIEECAEMYEKDVVAFVREIVLVAVQHRKRAKNESS